MIRLGISILIVASGFLAILLTADCDWYCDPSGCYVAGGGNPTPAPGKVYNWAAPDPNFNNPTVGNTSSCLVSSNTQFGTWTRHYQDGSTSDGVVYYYFSQGESGYLQMDTTNVDSSMKPFDSAGIEVWSSTLQANEIAPYSYYSLLPQEVTNDPSALVQISTSNSDPGYPGVTLAQLDPSGNYIGSVSVIYYLPETNLLSYDGKYLVTLHELGHSMMLAHNPDMGSAMFPGVDLAINQSDTCFHYNAATPSSSTRPPTQDTYVLEHQYDPKFRDTGGGGHQCGGHICYAPTQSSTRVALTNAQVRELTRHWPWYHVDDPLNAKLLSSAGLWLSSSLVVQGQITRTVLYVPDGLERVAIREFRIDRVIKHLLGPDTTLSAGRIIFVSDVESRDGEGYADDLALLPGSSPILFLRRGTGWPYSRLPVLIYVPTAPFVSKWFIDRVGRTHVAGAATSSIAREVSLKTISELMQTFARRYGARTAPPDEADLTFAMLRARGIAKPQDLITYEALLAADPLQILRWSIRQDIQSRPIYQYQQLRRTFAP